MIMPLLDDDTRGAGAPVPLSAAAGISTSCRPARSTAARTPLATARRELMEETGYEAADWRHLATLHPCIGYSDERIELYLARELTARRRTRWTTDEFLEVLPVPLAEALRLGARRAGSPTRRPSSACSGPTRFDAVMQ